MSTLAIFIVVLNFLFTNKYKKEQISFFLIQRSLNSEQPGNEKNNGKRLFANIFISICMFVLFFFRILFSNSIEFYLSQSLIQIFFRLIIVSCWWFYSSGKCITKKSPRFIFIFNLIKSFWKKREKKLLCQLVRTEKITFSYYK